MIELQHKSFIERHELEKVISFLARNENSFSKNHKKRYKLGLNSSDNKLSVLDSLLKSYSSRIALKEPNRDNKKFCTIDLDCIGKTMI